MTPKTARPEPVERNLSWLPLLSGWSTHPKTRRLRRADGANEGRWIHLVSLAHQCKAKGRLVMPDGTILTLEDLADSHDRKEEEWAAFVELCKELDLLSEDNDAALVVTSWANWNREAAHEREAAKYKKRSERAEAKLDDLQARNAALEAQIAEFRAYIRTVPVTTPEESTPVPALSRSCPDSVPGAVPEPSPAGREMSPNVPHLDLDETRHRQDKTREEVTLAHVREGESPALSPTPARPISSANGLTGTEFLPRIESIYRILTEATQSKARRLPDAEALALLKRLEADPWAQLGQDYPAIAIAIELGVTRTLDAIGKGQLQTVQPWRAALEVAETCIPEALAHVQSVEEAREAGLPPPDLKR